MTSLKPWHIGFLVWKKQLRERLSEAQGHRCAYCLCDIWRTATIEHYWPRSKRGSLTYENCVAACAPCNQARGNGQVWDQYWRVRKQRRAIKSAPRFYAEAA